MKLKQRIKCRLIALCLIIAITCSACVAKRGPVVNETETNSGSDRNYEQFEESSVKLQEEFNQLTDQIFKDQLDNGLSLHYALADPSAYGITDVPMTLGSYSLEEVTSNTQEVKNTKEVLDNMDLKKLTKEQQLIYKILQSVINAQLAGEGLELYDTPFTTTVGVQVQYPVLLAEYTFSNKQDVENYLSILSSIDTFYAQIMNFMKAKSEAGLMPCDATIDRIIASCEGYMIPASHNFLNDTFVDRLNELPDLTEEERQTYTERNIQILEQHFIPAYQNVVKGMEALRGTGTNTEGLWNLPKGKEYYEYLVQSTIYPSYSGMEGLKNVIEKRLKSDTGSITKLIQNNPDIIEQYMDPTYSCTEPEDILANLQEQIKLYYPELPECNYSLKHVPEALQNSLSPAFYLTPPLDHYQDNVIYINDRYTNQDLYSTMAHEGYPGHLYQNVYYASLAQDKIRYLLSFTSYSEGWGLYCELHSYLFDNGLDPDLGKLMYYFSSQTMGVYALLDINVNYFGWTKEQTATHLKDMYNITDEAVLDDVFYTLTENPTQYLKYYTGYLEFCDMANEAKKKKGDAFNLKEFHTFLLNIGPAPFDIIRDEFKYWLAQ